MSKTLNLSAVEKITQVALHRCLDDYELTKDKWQIFCDEFYMVMQGLPEKYRRVLELRFNLYGESDELALQHHCLPWLHDKGVLPQRVIAVVLGQSRIPPRPYAEPYIGQMEMSAIITLRSPDRYTKLFDALGALKVTKLPFSELKRLNPIGLSIATEVESRTENLSKPISALELPLRIADTLQKANITTVRELVTKEEAELLKYRNLGRKSIREIKEVLAKMGLSLGMKID